MIPHERRIFVHLAYVDDTCSDKKSPIVVMGAVLIHDLFFSELEIRAGMIVEQLIPPDRLDDFKEFHAFELYGGDGVFEGIDETVRREAMSRLLHQVDSFNCPFIYSAVDKKKLIPHAFGTAEPLDVAFRMCVLQIDHWLRGRGNDTSCGPAIVICDDTRDTKLKETLRASFRKIRPKIMPPWEFGRAGVGNIHDDMYFGSSKESIGIQLADVCTWVIQRSLRKGDVDDLYEEIAKHTICSKVEPEWKQNREVFLEYLP